MRVALVLPPLTQVNTPYPAPAYLARFLRDRGVPVTVWDLGLELVLDLMSRPGLDRVFDAVQELAEGRMPPGANPACAQGLPEPAWQALALRSWHTAAIEPVIRFLQSRDRTLARRILDTPLLPPGPRLDAAPADAFSARDVDDAARYRASLYLEDLADLVASTIDPGFGLARYQHHLALGPISYEPLHARLQQTTLVDALLDARVDAHLDQHPDLRLLGLSVPFPGTLYGALRIGRRARARGITVAMGGGYVTTELREVDEPRLWDCVDALVLDDGEGPLWALLQHLEGGPDQRHRTKTRQGLHQAPAPRPPTTAAAWYADLDLSRYLHIVDSLNPAHRLWGDGRWNKITLAHGCYWRRCAFCDTSLDYIARYEPARIGALVDAMEELVAQTGHSGFHLVDEAAPPRLLRDLALELLRRRLTVSFWGNIRFERAFTPDLCRLLAAAGLIMVTGGLEVASDRLLGLMDKGIDVDQAARAAWAFRQAGVRVHAYLMYGFPTETAQETVDAWEIVRQLFAAGALDSAFWHRFVLTRHSPVAADPGRFQVRALPPQGPIFAANDLRHEDRVGADPAPFEEPLARSLEAWMRGEELERPVESWLRARLGPSCEAPDRIVRALGGEEAEATGDRVLWLGGEVLEAEGGLVLHGMGGPVLAEGRPERLEWLAELVEAAAPDQPPLSWTQAKASFPGGAKALRRLLRAARSAGLVRI